MPATVYVWESGKKGGILNGDVGHAALLAGEGEHSYISFYPEGRPGLGDFYSSKPRFMLGYHKDPEADLTRYDVGAHHIIELGCINGMAVRQYWAQFKDQGPNWNLVFNNCSTVVYRALEIGYNAWFRNLGAGGKIQALFRTGIKTINPFNWSDILAATGRTARGKLTGIWEPRDILALATYLKKVAS